ncbi:energy-coupling factor ABC transporter permease, partial [Porphyromonas sp.]
MHIMEGFIPLKWCIIWYLIALPFVVFSYRFVARQIKATPRMKSSFALAAAYTFILSALKMPSVAGSSSHLTGTTLGTLTIGPMAMPLVGAIVLLFQALLLAHGGISTLGANIFSLSIAGPFVAYALFRLLTSARLPKSLVIFIATFCGSMATYIVTSFQLAVVYPDAVTGVMGAAWKFLGIFAITQVPLSIIEGILTVIVLRLLEKSQAK